MHSRIKHVWNRVISFSEKQGFPIIITVCIGIITASAVWSAPATDAYAAPTPPVNQDVSAAQLLQESLRHASMPTPTATATPPQWCSPLEHVNVITPFSTSKVTHNDATGLWQIHAGVDLSGERNSPVYAIADGTVIAHGNDVLLGTWLCVSHGDIEALYAGMTSTADYITGDKMDMHDIIGYVGSGPKGEELLGPHLHLETRKNGTLIDPLSLWNNH